MDAIDTEAEQLTTDPVCGREIAVGMELLDTEYGGKVYPFCSEYCRMLFALHPEQYVAEPAGDASG
jgi:YHS domain-containing protein